MLQQWKKKLENRQILSIALELLVSLDPRIGGEQYLAKF